MRLRQASAVVSLRFQGCGDPDLSRDETFFGMPLRQTTVFVESLLRLAGLDWKGKRALQPVCATNPSYPSKTPRSPRTSEGCKRLQLHTHLVRYFGNDAELRY